MNITSFFQKQTSNNADPRRSDEKLIGGRRKGENDNPYLSARRTWNDHTQAVLSFPASLANHGNTVFARCPGCSWRHNPCRPVVTVRAYVVQVDKLGQTAAVSVADQAVPTDPRVIAAAISAFIANARLVTPDVALQRKAVFDVYALLPSNVPATQKMTEFYNATEESSPFKRAAKEMISAEINTVMPHTADTWQVDWVETTRDRQGAMKGRPVLMRAMVTIFIVPPTPATTEEQLRKNPLGIFVRDFTWSRLQQAN